MRPRALQRFNLLVFRAMHRLMSPVVAEGLRDQLPHHLEHARVTLEDSQIAPRDALAMRAHLSRIEHAQRRFEQSEARLQASIASLEVVVENLRDDVAGLQKRRAPAEASSSDTDHSDDASAAPTSH
jgi:hypothetical protein